MEKDLAGGVCFKISDLIKDLDIGSDYFKEGSKKPFLQSIDTLPYRLGWIESHTEQIVVDVFNYESPLEFITLSEL